MPALGLGRPSSAPTTHPHAPSGSGPSPSTTTKRNVSRREASGGVFQMFGAKQVQQFKQTFDLMDVDGDGKVSESDLRESLVNLGQIPTPALIESFFSPSSLSSTTPTLLPPSSSSSSSSPNVPSERALTFTQYLTLMSRRLIALDGEAELVQAFACFDEDDNGWVGVAEMRMWLGGLGDRMGEREIDRLLKGPFTDSRGRFNYLEWARTVNVNDGQELKEGVLTEGG